MQSVRLKNRPDLTVPACLWLGLFPLLQTGTYSHITLDKWLFMISLTVLTLIWFIISLLFSEKAAKNIYPFPVFWRTPAFWLGFLLLLWILLSNLFSPLSLHVCFIGGTGRREGFLTQLCYLTIFFCFLLSRVQKTPLLLSAGIGLVVFAVVVLLQRAGSNPLSLYPDGYSYASTPEFQGTIGNVDMVAGYQCLLSGLFLSPCLFTKHTLVRFDSGLFFFSLIMLALCVFLLVSIRVQFGLLTLGVLAVWTFLHFLPKKWRLSAILLLLVIFLAVVWCWPGSSGGLWELHEILHGRLQLSFGSNRLAVWKYSLGLAGQNWILGSGSDSFVFRFDDYCRQNGLVIPEFQGDLQLPVNFDNPHNEYLAQWLNHGFPSMILFLLLILTAMFRKKGCGTYSLAVLAYAVQAFFSFSICIIAPLFWVLLGLQHTEAETGF